MANLQNESAKSEGPQGEAPKTESAQGEPERGTAMTRAEEMVDQAGERLGAFAADVARRVQLGDVNHRLQVLLARAREEAEDIWAEAQSVRESTRASQGQTSDTSGGTSDTSGGTSATT